jgi:hypothetical protein
MKTKPIEVSDKDGKMTTALLTLCEKCDSERFVIYHVIGKQMQLQCIDCGTSYCHHKGPCGGTLDVSP